MREGRVIYRGKVRHDAGVLDVNLPLFKIHAEKRGPPV